MRAKTKKKFERIVVVLLVLVFALGTVLLYLPVGTTTPQTQTTAPAQPTVPGP